MDGTTEDDPAGILNEPTQTIHRGVPGADGFHSECGVTYHVDADHLRGARIEGAAGAADVTKCGRGFEDQVGY
jgi:hypothetical protein